MSWLDDILSIFNRSANERRYLISISKTLPTFSPRNVPAETEADDLYGDPITQPIVKPTLTQKLIQVVSKPTGMLESRDIIHCHPYIQERWERLKKLYMEATGKDLSLTCTWRSVEKQQELYKQGREVKGDIVTSVNGIDRLSQHNYYKSRAIDVCCDVDPDVTKVKPSWDLVYYKPLEKICADLGLVSGGSWKKLQDWPHIQLPRNVV